MKTFFKYYYDSNDNLHFKITGIVKLDSQRVLYKGPYSTNYHFCNIGDLNLENEIKYDENKIDFQAWGFLNFDDIEKVIENKEIIFNNEINLKLSENELKNLIEKRNLILKEKVEVYY